LHLGPTLDEGLFKPYYCDNDLFIMYSVVVTTATGCPATKGTKPSVEISGDFGAGSTQVASTSKHKNTLELEYWCISGNKWIIECRTMAILPQRLAKVGLKSPV